MNGFVQSVKNFQKKKEPITVLIQKESERELFVGIQNRFTETEEMRTIQTQRETKLRTLNSSTHTTALENNFQDNETS